MNDRGSVTVYSMLVLVPILLFLGLLFDYVRIQAADAHVDKEVKAVARSVLSAYDRQLRETFGLFGLAAGPEEQLKIAKETVNGFSGSRIEESGKETFFSIKPRMTSLSVQSVYTLADHRFFRHQIMEEMKIKAPVEFTRHVFDKFKDQAQQMEQAPIHYEISEQAEKWMEQREQFMQDAFDKLSGMSQPFSEGKAILETPLPKETDLADEVSEGMKENAVDNVATAFDDGGSSFTQLQSLLDQLSMAIRGARQVENQLQEHFSNNEEEAELWSHIEIYGDAYFTQYELGASIPVSMFGAAMNARNAGTEFVDTTFHYRYSSFFAAKEAEEQKRRNAFEQLKRHKDEERTKTRERMNEVKNTISEQVCGLEEEQHYVRLSGYYDHYMALNTTYGSSEVDPSPVAALQQSPEQMQKGSMFGLAGLSQTLKIIRDEAYINEYIFLYFNNRATSKQEKLLISQVKSHLLQDQETEFILYGLSSCTANRAAAYAELFTMRFAIRTIESLVDLKKAAGSPMLALLTAAAEGVLKAQQDMTRLLNGESIPVFARVPKLTMDYSDYLRTFMAVHSREVKKMSRMQALIQLNTGIDLVERPVYIQAELSSILKLRMIPAVSRALARSSDQGGAGSSHQMTKKAAMAY